MTLTVGRNGKGTLRLPMHEQDVVMLEVAR
jgi:hypothetical protein